MILLILFFQVMQIAFDKKWIALLYKKILWKSLKEILCQTKVHRQIVTLTLVFEGLQVYHPIMILFIMFSVSWRKAVSTRGNLKHSMNSS